MVDARRSREALAEGLALSGLTVEELAGRCTALGDDVTPALLRRMVGTTAERGDHEHDVVAAALHERFLETGEPRRTPLSADLPAP
ncbi:hypothetical protein WDZ16_02690 [Pseudokineococcus marinus]|uniref:ANTAR domain-containing protein n=1 Tax=Pseudokineococcus marinus TaxID=351215 RepID=A0A849BVV8_9ACTN|nr:hypothetical protein [Pseudokineococcus marinus]NNH23626.1 hypothetical protein [Pseudokineococcus marinus]